MTVESGASVSDAMMTGGGEIVLGDPTATLAGTLTFTSGFNTLQAGLSNMGAGDQAVINGFKSDDAIDVTGVGSVRRCRSPRAETPPR